MNGWMIQLRAGPDLRTGILGTCLCSLVQGGPNTMKRYIIFFVMAIYNTKRTKTPEDIEQINITSNRLLLKLKLFPCFPAVYVLKSPFLSPVLSHRRTHSTDTHSRTNVDRNLSALPREFINEIASQLKRYMTFLSSEVFEAVQLKDSLLVDSAAEHC